MLSTRIAGIPCLVQLTHYSPYRDNRRGHIDSWLPDDPEEIEFEVCDRNGRPAPWLERKLTEKETARIEQELLENANDLHLYT